MAATETSLCLCWRFERVDGATFGATDHDVALAFDGVTYEPAAGLSGVTLTSTSGLAPQIRKLAEFPLQIRLAISLHGASDEVRDRIMPVNRVHGARFVRRWSDPAACARRDRQQLCRDALYAQYVDRQAQDAEALKRDESIVIPADFDYADLPGLSSELKAKLLRARPDTIAHAGRLEGMTPSALTLILARIRRAQRQKVAG